MSIRSRMYGLCAAGLLLASPCFAQTELTTELVADGFSRPVFVTAPPGDTERLFVVQQRGLIRIIELGSGSGPGTVRSTPFLDFTSFVSQSGNERGLLGLAFHPDYENNGFFYINFTDSQTHNTRILRLSVSPTDPNVAALTGITSVIGINQPFSNHNGGWTAFGPDGYLYFNAGDGGSGNDPQNHGQRTDTLLGAMLRIDVDNDDFPGDPDNNYAIPPDNPFVGQSGRDEIWSFGLRHPWRNSFDRHTGDLWIADVGQNAREEVNFQPASSEGGENYGWRLREGTIATPGSVGGPRPPGNVDPIWEYNTGVDGCAITGGYVYRGCRIHDLWGTYFVGDFCSARIWTFSYDGENVNDLQERQADLQPPSGSITQISSFGEDAKGDLYIVSLSGRVFRLIAADGYNGCDCPADFSGPAGVPDGIVDADDFFAYLAFFADGDLRADLTGPDGVPDGVIDADDFFEFLALFAQGC